MIVFTYDEVRYARVRSKIEISSQRSRLREKDISSIHFTTMSIFRFPIPNGIPSTDLEYIYIPTQELNNNNMTKYIIYDVASLGHLFVFLPAPA